MKQILKATSPVWYFFIYGMQHPSVYISAYNCPSRFSLFPVNILRAHFILLRSPMTQLVHRLNSIKLGRIKLQANIYQLYFVQDYWVCYKQLITVLDQNMQAIIPKNWNLGRTRIVNDHSLNLTITICL